MRHANSPKSATRVWTLSALLIFAVCVLGSWPAFAQAATDHAPAPVNLSNTALAHSRTPLEVTSGTAKLVGRYDRAAKLHVVLGLTHPKMAEEEAFLQQLQNKKSPYFHQYLTAEQWNARFAPSAKDEQAVVDWANANGLTVTTRYPNRLLVIVEGPPEAFEQAFVVQMNSYQVGNRVEFSNDRDPVIPSHLATVLHSVGGLNSIQRFHAPHGDTTIPNSAAVDAASLYTPQHADGNKAAYQAAMQAAAAAGNESPIGHKSAIGAANPLLGVQPQLTNGYLDPTDIYSAYGYDYNALQGQGHCCNPTGNSTGTTPTTTIGIATSGDFASSDITGFQAQYFYLSYYYNRRFIPLGSTVACCNDETTLDTEWSIATANSFGSYLDTAFVWVYEAKDTYLSTFTEVYQQMLTDGFARVFTTSWGCAELVCASSSQMDTDHGIFNSMVGQGWTLMAASGDAGATANCDDALRVQHPSSDPDVVAVGGTSLGFYSNDTFASETAWQGSTGTNACIHNGGGSTGGCSNYYAAPAYQTSPYCGSGSRSVPDVSLNAGYGQNYYFNGGLSGVGGTSIAAPQVAGFMAQANAYMLALGVGCGTGGASPCAPLGQANYSMYYEGYTGNYSAHNPFYDIVTGCNNNDITAYYGLGYYCAGTGYDAVTGWGSFNALQMAWSIIWNDVLESGAPSIAFSGPSTGVWYNSNQNVGWTVVDNVTGGPATGIAGFTQGWDSIPTDSTSEAVGARASGTADSFFAGPYYKNASTGCLALATGQPCSGGVSQGCHTAHVEGWNNMGRTSGDVTYGPVCYDTVAPTIGISNAPAANSYGWNNSTVTVTLSPADPGGSGASGIYQTYYAIDTGACYPGNLGACNVYTGPFAMTAQAQSYIYYFTEDYAGNFSAEPYEWVYIDETAPVTTATLGGTLNGSVYNSAVTVTLGATDNLSGVHITYYQLDGGSYTAYSSPLNVTALGTHTVKYYSVDYAGNTEATKTATFTIAQLAQTITFTNPGTQTYGTPLALTATASSGLPVTFTSTTTAVCSVSGSTATFLSSGTCTIKATQPGSTYLLAATPVSQSFTVNHEAQKITLPTIPTTTLITGSVTVAATASSGLPVTVVSTTPLVCSVSGTTITLIAVGTCGIEASAAGNIDYSAAPNVWGHFLVTLATQTINFPAISSQSYGTPVALSATASSGLTVSFASTTPTICTVSGTTATLLSSGTCSIKATQAGNVDYAAATAVTRSFTVNKASQTITLPTIPTTTLITGTVTEIATSSSGLPVTVVSTTPTDCTVSGTTITLKTVGTCGLEASQAGNSDYAAAPNVWGHFSITLSTQTITFPAISAKTYGTPVALSATASSGLTVSFASTTPTICTVSGTSATLLSSGTCTIKATQAGNVDYAAAPAVSQSFTVNKAAQTITLPTIPTTTLATGTVTEVATSSSGLPVTVVSTTPTDCTVSGTTITLKTVGTCGLEASQAGNSDYAAAPNVWGHFSITLSTQTITFPAISAKTYGTPVALSATASSGLPVTFTSTTSTVCTVSGTSATLLATGTCTIKATQAGNVDYAAAPAVSQSFTVNKAAQTITLPTIPTTTLATGTVTEVATSSSGLPVTVVSTTPLVCTVSGTTITLKTIGTCGLEASQAGNSDYAVAPNVWGHFSITN